MNRHKVLFLPYNKEITVDDGESLIRAAMEASVHVNASCGGEGVCGKCRVIIEEGSVEDGVSERLDSDDLEKGYRLACLSKIKGDITVRIPTESSIDESALNLTSTPRKTAHIKHINFEELKEQGLFVPPVEKLYLEMPEPDAQDHEPDVTRIINFLSQVYDEHQLQLNLPVIRKIPDVLRENDFKVTVTLERPVREGGKTRIINIQPGDTSAKNYAIALDIGTTTVYGQVVDLGTGETLSQSGTFNGQISYGEDVINRIVFAEKPGGLDKISEVVIETINKIIGKTIKKSGVERENISAITIAGNTTMTQLMLKINPSYIRRAPYVPAATLYPPV
ncbi:MAG: 2Fe-2S iron-sulfur cluster binding domain-containing protein, partial [Desulfobacterales bacterium]|nr:2Fe-2S iron-sulfur cluster binding domain-containing protein [Desulfobacterales bacterium]